MSCLNCCGRLRAFEWDGLTKYQKFGKMRNGTIHFALPVSGDWHSETLKFLFEVIEPLLHQFWHKSIALEMTKWDEVALEGFLQDQLAHADGDDQDLR